jgi:CRISPR-associated protein Csm2
MSLATDLANEIENGVIPDLTKANFKPEDYAPQEGYADKIAEEIYKSKEKMKVTQLRKVFSNLKTIYTNAKKKKSPNFEEQRDAIFLLSPELAYAKGRKLITDDFYKLMKACLFKTQNKKTSCRIATLDEFENFMKFFEAILAYYKFHEEKEKKE